MRQPFYLVGRMIDSQGGDIVTRPLRQMLVVDDEQDICTLLMEFFSAHGFSVVSAFSGEEALDQLAQGKPDVILLDILLPGISGIEVLKRAKQLHPRAQILMVTAIDDDRLRLEAHRFGAAGYITKPFDLSPHTWLRVLA